MSQLKSITLQLPEEEYKAFDAICNEKGYSKTGKIREFIRRSIKDEIESVKISEEDGKESKREWRRLRRENSPHSRNSSVTSKKEMSVSGKVYPSTKKKSLNFSLYTFS